MKYPLIKSPIWPALLSALIVPGTGQIMNRDFKKGFFLSLTFMAAFSWFFKVVSEQLSLLTTVNPKDWQTDPSLVQEQLMILVRKNPDMFLTFQILVLLIWIYSIVDAFISARNKNNLATSPSPDENAHPLS